MNTTQDNKYDLLNKEELEDIDCITDTLNKYLKRDSNEDIIMVFRDLINTLDEERIDDKILFNMLQDVITEIIID